MSHGAPTRFVTEEHPDRHEVVDNCFYTRGPTYGRNPTCLICLQKVDEEYKSVTHGLRGQGECNFAFHVYCFHRFVAEKLTDSGSASCPACGGTLYPYEEQGWALPPALVAEGERARFEEARAQAMNETMMGEAIVHGLPFDHRDELIFEPRSPGEPGYMDVLIMTPRSHATYVEMNMDMEDNMPVLLMTPRTHLAAVDTGMDMDIDVLALDPDPPLNLVQEALHYMEVHFRTNGRRHSAP